MLAKPPGKRAAGVQQTWAVYLGVDPPWIGRQLLSGWG
jgi:hypothetical protein